MPRSRLALPPFLAVALLLSLLAAAPGAAAQELSLDTRAQATAVGLDVDGLVADGWSETSPGLWVRESAAGAVQRLAYGEGRLAMVPALQAELEKLVGRIGVDPSRKLFDAIARITDTLETIHGLADDGAQDLRVTAQQQAPPPSCYPLHLTTQMFTFAAPPPGWHSILATASAYWDGDGYPCSGHTYTRAEYSNYHSVYGSLYDLDTCTDDDAYEGGCWVGVSTAYFDGFLSCHSEAYAYLTVANGAVILSETKESNSC